MQDERRRKQRPVRRNGNRSPPERSRPHPSTQPAPQAACWLSQGGPTRQSCSAPRSQQGGLQPAPPLLKACKLDSGDPERRGLCASVFPCVGWVATEALPPHAPTEQHSPLTLAGCPAELGLAAESGQQRPLTRSSLPSCPGSARGTQRASETRAPAPRKADDVHQPRGLRRSTLLPSRLAYSPASLQAGTRPPGPAPPHPQVHAQATAPRLCAGAG